MGSDRAAALAARVDAVNDEVIAFAQRCSREEWRRTTTDEQWPVGVVCRHIARSFEVYPAIIRRQVSGEPPPAGYTWDDIHRSNAQQAQEWAEGTQEEAVALLRRHGDALTRTIRPLTDRQLDRTAASPLTGTVRSTEQVIESMIGHAHGHLESAWATVSRAAG